MQSELKPCPFCGGEPEYHSDKGPTGEVYAWVGCNQCDAMSVHCDVRSMQPEETHPIEAWNARASDAEITRLTEALCAAEEREKGLREVAIKLHGALAAHTCEGCPRCPGDCAGANPPMMDCPTQRAIEAYRAFDAALKGPSHDQQ